MRSFVLSLLCAVALGSLSACSLADDGTSAAADEVKATNGIAFKAKSFAVETTGKLTAGRTVRIDYDLDRLPQCRGNVGGGGPAWSITGYASFNGKPAANFEVSKVVGTERKATPYELRLTEGGDLAVWFNVSNRWGCNEYDSLYGQNFHFSVDGSLPVASSTLTFGADGSVRQTAPLEAGSLVAVRYEQDRLKTCRSSYNGYAAWSITGHARVNGGAEQKFSTSKPLDAYGEEREVVTSYVQLGEQGELELWFENTGRECVGWDSKNGANYRFAIE